MIPASPNVDDIEWVTGRPSPSMLDVLMLDWPVALSEALAWARSYRDLLRVALGQLHERHVEVERLRLQLGALREECQQFRHAGRPPKGPALVDERGLPTMADPNYRRAVLAYVAGLTRRQVQE